MSQERFPWIYRDLESRCLEVAPRFDPPIHHCPKCGRDWFCSDRYTQDSCSPQRFYPDFNEITCSPCTGGDVYDEEDVAAWRAAHAVKEPDSEVILPHITEQNG